MTILIKAIMNNDINAVKTILKYSDNSDLNTETCEGWGPTLEAIKADNQKCLEILLNNGAKINYQNRFGNTALIIAVCWKRVDCVKFLLSKGADTTLRGNDSGNRKTALEWAIYHNNKECVNLLQNFSLNKALANYTTKELLTELQTRSDDK